MKTIFFLACAATVFHAHADTLALRCDGTANYTAPEFSSSSNANSEMHHTNRLLSGPAVLRFRMDGDGARIRFPKNVLPLISSDKDGWFMVEKLSVNERDIRGEVPFNFINAPKLVINRNNGEIEVKGGSDFSYEGTCAKDTSDSKDKKF